MTESVAVVDSDEELHRGHAGGIDQDVSEDQHALQEGLVQDQSNLERAATVFLRKRGYHISEAPVREAPSFLQHASMFNKVVKWAATISQVRDELLAALAPLAARLASGLECEEVSAARQFRERHADLLARFRFRSERTEEHVPEVFMSALAHGLLVSRFSRPELLTLADMFFDAVRVNRRPEVHTGQQLSHSVFAREAARINATSLSYISLQAGKAPGNLEGKDSRKGAKSTSIHRLPLPPRAAYALSQQDASGHQAVVAHVIEDHDSEVQVAALSQDGKFCAAAWARDLVLWSSDLLPKCIPLESDLPGYRLGSHSGRLLSAAFAPSSEFLLSGGQEGQLRLWNTTSRTASCVYRQKEPAWCVDWSPWDHYFASSGLEGALLWSVERSSPLRVLARPSAPSAQAIRFHPGGHLAAVATSDSLMLWDLAAAKPVRVLSDCKGATVLGFSPDGLALAFGSQDGSLSRCDLLSARASTVHCHRGCVTAVAWSGNSLLSGCGDELQLRDMSHHSWSTSSRQIKVGMEQMLCAGVVRGHCLVVGSVPASLEPPRKRHAGANLFWPEK
ncbi:unnamed protein product, partial [Effrenium voratum]